MCASGVCEPGLELAGGAKEIDLCLGCFEVGVEKGDGVVLPLACEIRDAAENIQSKRREGMVRRKGEDG